MIIRHITTVVGVSSFCLGIWLDRKYREFNKCLEIPGFKIFDAVNADSIVNNNQQLMINNEERISEVRCIYNTIPTYLNTYLYYVNILNRFYLTCIYLPLLTHAYFLDNEIWISKFG